MIAALKDDQSLALDPVNEAVFAVDATGPEAGIVAPQRFWLTCSPKGMALAFAYEPFQFGQHRAVTVLPIEKLLKRVGKEEDPHSFSNASSSSIVFTTPGTSARKSAMALSSAALLAGEAVR